MTGLTDARVYGLLDPVADLLRGALPYHDAAATLPDGQAVPSLRIRRRVDAPGLRVAIDRYRDDERLGGDELGVDRFPLDRAIAPSRRRRNPMPTSLLRISWPGAEGATPGVDASDVPVDASGVPAPVVVPGASVRSGGDDDETRIVLPATGLGRQDLDAVLAAARSVRLVLVDGPPSGELALLAALVLQVVAAGTPCRCDAGLADRLELLGPELRALLTFDVEPVLADDLLLASRTARQKRAAWSEHDLRLAWGPGTGGEWTPRLRPVPWPAVSIVMPSRRPNAVAMAMGMMASQVGVELEVVVALHGAGDVDALETERRRLGLAGHVRSVPADVPFGAVINDAISHTSAPVVLKWDDDDLYGPRHVQDLLIARRQTGAALVGKAAEFVYFDASRRTIWRNPGRAEADSVGMAGGTLMTDRAVLDEIGGYPDVAFAEDHHLKLRLRDLGMHPFRTHAFGFVLRRHGLGHSWDASEEQLAAKALRSFDGLPEILELGDAATATRLPEG